jgi:hypothetical protein
LYILRCNNFFSGFVEAINSPTEIESQSLLHPEKNLALASPQEGETPAIPEQSEPILLQKLAPSVRPEDPGAFEPLDEARALLLPSENAKVDDVVPRSFAQLVKAQPVQERRSTDSEYYRALDEEAKFYPYKIFILYGDNFSTRHLYLLWLKGVPHLLLISYATLAPRCPKSMEICRVFSAESILTEYYNPSGSLQKLEQEKKGCLKTYFYGSLQVANFYYTMKSKSRQDMKVASVFWYWLFYKKTVHHKLLNAVIWGGIYVVPFLAIPCANASFAGITMSSFRVQGSSFSIRVRNSTRILVNGDVVFAQGNSLGNYHSSCEELLPTCSCRYVGGCTSLCCCI